MAFTFQNILKGVVISSIGACIFTATISMLPHTASAQIACLGAQATAEGKASANQATNVPITSRDIESSTHQQSQVSCLFNGLAQAMAKVALQKMTSDIVGWINNGFEGNPAFPTNPEAFFLGAADAVSGEFLSHQGPLSQLLCSPWSLDIRLSLALNLQSNRQQYACTLSDIFRNAQNGPNISINGQRINGGSIEGFINGDFSQGGWPAFLEMTTNPANNIYGSYLMADADLRSQIAAKQNALHVDLTLGQGFMSWQKCDDITPAPASQISGSNELDYEAERGAQYEAGQVVGAQRKVEADGTVKYRKCTTQTPGSVIGASVNKSLGSSVDQIVNIHDIDQAVSQVASALIFQTLKKGLAAASRDGSASNGRGSLMDELARKENKDQMENKQKNLLAKIDDALANTNGYFSIRQQAVDVLVAEKNVYLEARVCYEAKPDPKIVKDIDTKLNGVDTRDTKIKGVNDKIAEYAEKIDVSATAISDAVSALLDFQSRLYAVTTIEEILKLSNEQGHLLGMDGVVDNQKSRNAKNSLADARALATKWHDDATKLLNECTSTSNTAATETTTAQ